MMYTSLVKDFDLMQEVTTYLGQLSDFYDMNNVRVVSWDIYMNDSYQGYRVEILIDEKSDGS